MVKFIPPFPYKGHSLYATLIERSSSMGMPQPARWQGYVDNKPLHEWAPKLDETLDDVRQRLRTEAEASIQTRPR